MIYIHNAILGFVSRMSDNGMHMENDTQTFRGSSGSRPKGGPFSLRSAILVTAALTIFLWWLPVFGQIAAGYTGGRRSGSAAKGFAASSAAIIIFVAAAFLLPYFGLSISESQNAVLDAVAGGYPELIAFAASTFSYVTGIFEAFGSGSEAIAACAVTVAFGIAGGIASGQAARELSCRSLSADAPRSMRSANVRGRHASRPFEERVPLNGTQTRTDQPAPGSAKRPETPVQAAAPEPESPFASLLQMSDRKQTAASPAAAEKQIKEDLEYV